MPNSDKNGRNSDPVRNRTFLVLLGVTYQTRTGAISFTGSCDYRYTNVTIKVPLVGLEPTT